MTGQVGERKKTALICSLSRAGKVTRPNGRSNRAQKSDLETNEGRVPSHHRCIASIMQVLWGIRLKTEEANFLSFFIDRKSEEDQRYSPPRQAGLSVMP